MEDKDEVILRPIYESRGVCVWASDRLKHVNECEQNVIESSCLGKFKYPTPESCRTAINLFKRKKMDCYLCRFCGSYHLTSKDGDGSLD